MHTVIVYFQLRGRGLSFHVVFRSHVTGNCFFIRPFVNYITNDAKLTLFLNAIGRDGLGVYDGLATEKIDLHKI